MLTFHRACKRVEAHQHHHLQTQQAFNQELLDRQRQHYIDLMAALRSGGHASDPATPTRTPRRKLADAGHAPQLQWGPHDLDDYSQQLSFQQQHEQQHQESDGSKGYAVSRPSPIRVRPGQGDAAERYASPAHLPSVRLVVGLTVMCSVGVQESYVL